MIATLQQEQWIRFTAAARLYSGAGSRPTSPSTLWRWATKGVPGPDGTIVRLGAKRLGRTWMTTAAEMQLFMDRLTPRFTDGQTAVPRTATQVSRAAEAAGRKLDAIGI